MLACILYKIKLQEMYDLRVPMYKKKKLRSCNNVDARLPFTMRAISDPIYHHKVPLLRFPFVIRSPEGLCIIELFNVF